VKSPAEGKTLEPARHLKLALPLQFLGELKEIITNIPLSRYFVRNPDPAGCKGNLVDIKTVLSAPLLMHAKVIYSVTCQSAAKEAYHYITHLTADIFVLQERKPLQHEFHEIRHALSV
jgi:hypothetical protein